MHEGGFLEQQRMSPLGFSLVVVGHAAVLGALILIKGPEIIPADFGKTTIFTPVPPPKQDPPPPPPEPLKAPVEVTRAPTTLDRPPPILELPSPGPIVRAEPFRPIPEPPVPGPVIIPPRADPPPTPDPVRVEARYDTRYADSLQPPYPASEQRAQNSGQVRLRVTIGTDGRVKAVEKLSATSDAFWTMAERHARTRWRFRPATVDGEPVESQKVMTLHFRIENA